MGDTVNAMRDYQAAICLEPDYSLAYYNAANLYFKQRQFQQVETCCISKTTSFSLKCNDKVHSDLVMLGLYTKVLIQNTTYSVSLNFSTIAYTLIGSTHK